MLDVHVLFRLQLEAGWSEALRAERRRLDGRLTHDAAALCRCQERSRLIDAMPWHEPTLSPDDLLVAAAISRVALESAIGRDWSVPAGDLEWSCRRTLDHVFDALIHYAGNLATRSTEIRSSPDVDTSSRPVAVALTMMGTAAAILAEVVRAAPPGARGWHEAGMADTSGFVAMGCEEILVHSDDIAQGFGLILRPPTDLVNRVRARLFPWAPTDIDPWDALRWAAGRTALPTSPRLGPEWGWHCSPLAEWDGTIAKAKWPV